MLVSHVVLFGVMVVLVRYHKYVGWRYIFFNYALLTLVILLSWLFVHSWVWFSGNFLDVLTNCIFALVYGAGLGVQHAKALPHKE